MKSFRPLKKGGGGHEKFYPVLRGGGAQKKSDQRFSNFVAPHPVINDQSLSQGWITSSGPLDPGLPLQRS